MPPKLDLLLSQERIDAANAAGWWPNRLLIDHLDVHAARQPDAVAITGVNSMRRRRETVSWRQLKLWSERIALGLVAHGIGKGDVVSLQLPNWWEFTAIHLACLRIGAITNPVMPIFRHRELKHMFGLAEAKIVFVPRNFRAFDFPQMMSELRPDLPALEHVFALGGAGPQSFEEIFLLRRWEDEMDGAAIFAERRLSPNDVIQILYTSGTTGEPKGVMHTSNTLLANVAKLIERYDIAPGDVMFMGSPLAHQTGFLVGLMLPIVLGTKCVLQDIWDAEEATQMFQDERVTVTMASTPFLADLTSTPGSARYDLSSFQTFASGGAPIPRVLVRRAQERLGAFILSVWGMSETGVVTTTRRGDPPEKAYETDGSCVDNMEIRVVGPDNRPLPPNQEGLLKTRGASLFVGYLKRPELAGLDAEGWFDTGDLARIDEDGYMRITGRAKDIIIRGGENIPVIEIEEMLYRHPAIEDAAVVGMPDERLGERACAFVTLKPNFTLSFEEMIRFLLDQKMSRTYLPERLEIVAEMPRTPSGKIQKFRLREQAKSLTVQG